MHGFLYSVSLLAFTLFLQTSGQLDFLSDEFIESINSQNTSWEAGRNFDKNLPLQHIKALLGTKLEKPNPSISLIKHDQSFIENLPEEFDPRKKWPHCRYIGHIRDQGGCGSCWAFAGVGAITDRICISSGGKKQPYLSVQDVVSCSMGLGCQGGLLTTTWEFWGFEGIVTGGDYNSHEGCRPYEIKCHDERGHADLVSDTPLCKRECQAGYNTSYLADKIYGSDPYLLLSVDGIRAELFKNGPVEVAFTVYTDFASYKKGVYQHVRGFALGGHAVKLMGWGVENDVPYWLVANSWNSTWGDNGFFKIRRGNNECGIEDIAVAAKPLP